MAEIKFGGWTYVGTAEGEHGVFTRSDGAVYEGQIAGDYPCVGVATWTDGTTYFVECDADGKKHGRVLRCFADGHTVYRRYEHGSQKEHAVLFRQRHLRVQRQGLPCGLRGAAGDGRADQGASPPH